MNFTQEAIDRFNRFSFLKNGLSIGDAYSGAEQDEDTVPRILTEKWLLTKSDSNQKLSSRFNTLSAELRPVLLNFFNKLHSTTDKELLLLLDNLNESGTTQDIAEKKVDSLERERAALTVNKYVSENVIDSSERDFYIKLATNSFEDTIQILEAERMKKIEVDSLLILSDDELYFSEDKLERLKTLSPVQFKCRYKKIFGAEFKG